MFPGFDLFGRYIGMYQVMALLGAFAAGGFAIAKFKAVTKNGYPMLATLLVAAVGTGIGSSLLYALTNIRYWFLFTKVTSFDDFVTVVTIIFGGGVFYGGLIGGIVAAAIFMKIRKYDAMLISDIMASGVALFHCFGRIGCFLGGCCYGKECDWGIMFTHSLVEEANGVRRIPVQLFEAGFELILFFFLWYLFNKGLMKNREFALYIVLYGIWRFFIEFYRGDVIRGFIFGLSTSQFISLLLIPAALGWIIAVTVSEKRVRQQK